MSSNMLKTLQAQGVFIIFRDFFPEDSRQGKPKSDISARNKSAIGYEQLISPGNLHPGRRSADW